MEGLHPKLAGQLQDRVDQYAKKGAKLWEEVGKISETLGAKDSEQVGGYTIVTYRFTFLHDGSICNIMKSSYSDGCRYLSVMVDHQKVLFVSERDKQDYESASELDRKTMVLIQDQYYKVAAYIPGEWEQWLNLNDIQASLEKKGNEDQPACLESENDRRFYSDLDMDIARSFGIPL